MIAIVDYGVGNLYSLEQYFKAINAQVVVTGKPEILQKADKILHGHAQDYEDISLLTELYLGAKELLEHPEYIEQDEDYTWFGGVDKKHIYGPKKNAICYKVGKI